MKGNVAPCTALQGVDHFYDLQLYYYHLYYLYPLKKIQNPIIGVPWDVKIKVPRLPCAGGERSGPGCPPGSRPPGAAGKTGGTSHSKARRAGPAVPVGNHKLQGSQCQTVKGFGRKSHTELPYHPATPHLGIYPKEKKAGISWSY